MLQRNLPVDSDDLISDSLKSHQSNTVAFGFDPFPRLFPPPANKIILGTAVSYELILRQADHISYPSTSPAALDAQHGPKPGTKFAPIRTHVARWTEVDVGMNCPLLSHAALQR